MRKDSPTLHWLEQAFEVFDEYGGTAHAEVIELVVRRMKELYRLGASFKLAGQQAARDFGANRRNDVTVMMRASHLKAS